MGKRKNKANAIVNGDLADVSNQPNEESLKNQTENIGNSENVPEKQPKTKDQQTGKRHRVDVTEQGEFEQHYSGFVPTKKWKIERIDPKTITPEKFFSDYICTRTPCIFTSHLPDPEWNVNKWVSPPEQPSTSKVSPFSYLIDAAGSEVVYVEHKVNGGFGSGEKRQKMLFGDFIAKLEEGESSLYLTTQYGQDDDRKLEADDSDENDDGQPLEIGKDSLELLLTALDKQAAQKSNEGLQAMDDNDDDDEDVDFAEDGIDDYDEEISDEESESDKEDQLFKEILSYCQAPLLSLLDDFPRRPELLGNLIPQQVNLWMGSAEKSKSREVGASSGLHHDYADNVYAVLKGRKRFTLFSPNDADKMYTHGRIAKIHENGLITYWPDDMDKEVFDDSILDENIDEEERAEFIAGKKESLMLSLPRADGAYPLDVAKYKVDECLERYTRLQLRHAPHAEIEEAEKELQQAIQNQTEVMSKVHTNDEVDSDIFDEFSDESDDNSDKDENGDANSNEKNSNSGEVSPSSIKGKEKELPPQSDEEPDISKDEIQPPPPSFSKIPVEVLRGQKPSDEFPLLKTAKRFTFDIHEGEMLYLPAGWFHEVTSLPLPKVKGKESMPIDRIHMALSYWMHPPTQTRFEKPYEDSYWEDSWERIDQEIVKYMEDEKNAALESEDDLDESEEEDNEELSIAEMMNKPYIKKRGRRDPDSEDEELSDGDEDLSDEDEDDDDTQFLRQMRVIKHSRMSKRRLVEGWRQAKEALNLGEWEVRNVGEKTEEENDEDSEEESDEEDPARILKRKFIAQARNAKRRFVEDWRIAKIEKGPGKWIVRNIPA